MRSMKLLFAAFALMLTTSTFANMNSDWKAETENISYERGKTLEGSDFITCENFKVKRIFFNEANRIPIGRVSSPNKKVNEYLMKRLENQKLYFSSLDLDRVYMLAVKEHSRC